MKTENSWKKKSLGERARHMHLRKEHYGKGGNFKKSIKHHQKLKK